MVFEPACRPPPTAKIVLCIISFPCVTARLISNAHAGPFINPWINKSRTHPNAEINIVGIRNAARRNAGIDDALRMRMMSDFKKTRREIIELS